MARCPMPASLMRRSRARRATVHGRRRAASGGPMAPLPNARLLHATSPPKVARGRLPSQATLLGRRWAASGGPATAVSMRGRGEKARTGRRDALAPFVSASVYHAEGADREGRLADRALSRTLSLSHYARSLRYYQMGPILPAGARDDADREQRPEPLPSPRAVCEAVQCAAEAAGGGAAPRRGGGSRTRV